MRELSRAERLVRNMERLVEEGVLRPDGRISHEHPFNQAAAALRERYGLTLVGGGAMFCAFCLNDGPPNYQLRIRFFSATDLMYPAFRGMTELAEKGLVASVELGGGCFTYRLLPAALAALPAAS